MLDLPIQRECRLSGESLEHAPVLLELADCPLPGIYPATVEESLPLRSPVRVVQAPRSKFVQLGHHFDGSIYEQYAFAANTSRAYREHLEWFARELHASLGPSDSVLEVGCGDGLLLEMLSDLGHHDLLGIDPGRAAGTRTADRIVHGYFPYDLPEQAAARRYRRIVVRHVLEHIEDPRAFIAELAARLADDGELWIEVPDLDATLARGRWSNFYQLHCNYFDANTLDRLAATAGLGFVAGASVEVFGGSILRRYAHGRDNPSCRSRTIDAATADGFVHFQESLDRLAATLPRGTVGYGAAERTALTFGASAALERRIRVIFDSNPLLHGRRLAGTGIEVRPPEELYDAGAPAVVLFAVSHQDEVLDAWRCRLDPSTPVAVADGQCSVVRLGDT